MSNNALAKRYAKAIFELANEAKKLDDINAEFNLLYDMLSEKEFSQFINNPLISSENSIKVIKAVAEKMGLSELSKNIIILLCKNGRLKNLPSIIESLKELVRENKGIVLAKVTSASDLKKDQLEKMQRSLEKSLNSKIELQSETDSSIIGGIILQFGSKMLDASVAGKLENFRVEGKKAVSNI